MFVVHLGKNIERIQKFMLTGNTSHSYKNNLVKACFQHDMASDRYEDLTKRTESDKVLKDKAFKIVSNPKYDEYEHSHKKRKDSLETRAEPAVFSL